MHDKRRRNSTGMIRLSPVLRHSAAVVILLVAGVCARAAGWSRVGWQYKRAITVTAFKPTGLGGKDVAVVTMSTGGLARADCRDLRVVAGLSKVVPHRLLMVGPGDQVRFAFTVLGKLDRYSVFFGNPKAPKPTSELEIKRGVLLETWQYTGGAINTLPQVRKIFSQARPGHLLGRDFRSTVFLGHNPFGSTNRIASVFTGWLIAPKTGRYTFACSSRNASFLLIDDKPVVNNGGWHAPVRDIRKRATTDLKAGLHKLTFYYVTGKSDPVAVAAWQAPGDKRVWVIPSGAYSPVFRGTAGPTQKYGATLTVDFTSELANEAFMMDRYFQRFRFRATWSGQGGTRAKWQWDFGDGQVSTEASPEHVYLVPGMYTVVLTGTIPGRPPQKRTNRIHVARPWDRVTSRSLDSVRHHANIVANYNFKTYGPESTAWAVRLLDRTGKRDAILKAGSAFVARAEAPPESIRTVMLKYAEILSATGAHAKAVTDLQQAATLTKNPAVCAEMLTRAGQICLLDKSRITDALTLFETVIKRYAHLTKSSAIREARMGVGDVWRSRGDYAKAAKAYTNARGGAKDHGLRAPVVKGDFARHVEEYIRTRDFESAEDYLKRWTEAFPLDKLEGYWSLLAIQLAMAQRRYTQAAVEAEVLVAVHPASSYAAEALMLAAQAYKSLKNTERYKATLKRVVDKYPESPLSLQAAKLLRAR